jgi:hypothetical protein
LRKLIHKDLPAQIRDKLSAWKTEPDREARDRLMLELLAMLTDENAAEIARSLSPEDLAERFGVSALDRWLNQNPEAAATWLASRPDTTAEQASLVARRLLSLEGGFQKYLDQVPSGEWREKILNAAGFEIASTNPQQAIAFADRMSPGQNRTALFQSSGFEWARTDPDAAMKWVSEIEDNALREQVSAWTAKGLASNDPEKAATWLVASVKNEELLLSAAQSVVRSWAANSPAAAADWVAHFPTGPVQNEALETLMAFWSGIDSEGARSWVSGLPDSALRQKASGILDRTPQNPANAGGAPLDASSE